MLLEDRVDLPDDARHMFFLARVLNLSVFDVCDKLSGPDSP